MPNLMVHGFHTESSHDPQLVSDMINAMQSIGLGDEAIITIVPSCAWSCDGQQRSMPYVRIATTGSAEEVDRIIEALRAKSIGLDIEVLRLSRFIEAKDMT